MGSGFPYPGDGSAEQWFVYDMVSCVMYALLWLFSSAVLVATLRTIWDHVPRSGIMRMFWRTRMLAVHLISIQTLVRSVYFLVASGTRDLDEASHRSVLLTLFALMLIPDWLYYTIFSIVVHYWVSLYYTSAGQPRRSVWIVRALAALNIVVYISGILALALAGSSIGTRRQWAMLFSYSAGIAAICLALFFVYYGVRLVLRLRMLPASHGDIRRRVVTHVGVISSACFVCFVYRASYVLAYPTTEYGELWRPMTYLIIGEALPTLLLLLMFQILPRRLEGKAPLQHISTSTPPITPRPSLATPGRKTSGGPPVTPAPRLDDDAYDGDFGGQSIGRAEDRVPLRQSRTTPDAYGAVV